MDAPKDFHVLIVGAGISGLILAQALKKESIPFTIFEKESSLNVRSNEWTMAIHWALDRLGELLPGEVYSLMEQASCNPSIPIQAGGNYPIIHGETGNMLAGVPYKQGLRVPRSKMRKLCGEGIDVLYSKQLRDVIFPAEERGEENAQHGSERTVTAVFEDGSRYEGNLIVGADGCRSLIRELAMGSPEAAATTPFPIWHMNMTVCYGDAEKAKYLRSEFPTSYLALSDRSFHAFQSISSMPDGVDHPESWVFHLAMAWMGEAKHELSHEERLAIIKEKAKGLAEPARSAFTWIPEGTQVSRADIRFWIPQQWDNKAGRMTLVGDAAHPMPPYRGQGLNHCIADIHSLVSHIKLISGGQTSPSDSISAYEQEVIVRGAEEVQCSIENGYMLHDWEKVKRSPVFTKGFRPMKGHDTYETNVDHEANQRKAEAARVALQNNKSAAVEAA